MCMCIVAGLNLCRCVCVSACACVVCVGYVTLHVSLLFFGHTHTHTHQNNAHAHSHMLEYVCMRVLATWLCTWVSFFACEFFFFTQKRKKRERVCVCVLATWLCTWAHSHVANMCCHTSLNIVPHVKKKIPCVLATLHVSSESRSQHVMSRGEESKYSPTRPKKFHVCCERKVM